jgi:hypothetical protein
LQTAKSLKEAFQFKYRASQWHKKFRAIDDLCLSIRLFHQIQSVECGITANGDDNISIDLMQTEELVIEELNEILKTELSRRGYVWKMAESAIRVVGETFNAAPLAQPDDFTFGILYLMQELAVVVNPGKFDDTVIHVALAVATMSSESRLQLKAFELLMALSKKIGITGLPIAKVEEFLENKNMGEERIERAERLWETTIKRASEMEIYSWKIRKGYNKKFPRTILQASQVSFPMFYD